ncbi:MAG TPA: gamma-glutamyltransferase [Thermomicrobiales bacterium]|nr:gamma-glutamyltransferase [Thermomicrobiales bacterium]
MTDWGAWIAETSKELPPAEQGTKTPARGTGGMVSTSHPLVTAVARKVLEDGGNAVDALLTAMPLQHVVEPQMSTPAGGFGVLYWEAASGKAVYLNANIDRASHAPVAADSVPFTHGLRIAVPGAVRGMQALAERYGTRDWGSYFEPAITVAEHGYPMYSFLYGEMAGAYDRINHHPSGRDAYAPDGFIPPVGETYRLPAFARALERLAQPDGPEWFQTGEFAERFVAEVNRTGGKLTLEDLASYQPRWQEPLAFRAFGTDFLGGPPPEYGPAYAAVGLGVLERTGFDPGGDWRDDPRAVVLIARSLKVADDYVGRLLLDPEGFETPIDVLLSDAFLQSQADIITRSFPKVDLAPEKPSPTAYPRPGFQGSAHTDSNHITIVDSQGNWLTMLHTVFGTPFGTGLVVDGISVNSGNIIYFGGTSRGGARRISTPLPPVFAMRDGAPWLGLGSPGASCHAVSQVLINMLPGGMGLYDAIDAPRFRLRGNEAGHAGWRLGTLDIETRLPASTVEGLERLGVDLAPLGDYNWHMGSIQAVMRDPDTGALIGSADPRRAGFAQGF